MGKNTPSSIQAAAFVAAILLSPASAFADANLNCNAYAGAAIAEVKQNAAESCGFTGNRWLNDFKAHFDWCAAAGTTMANLVAEDKAREDALTQCANKAVQAQQACQSYAQLAVGEAAAAAENSCGFSGGGWSSDYAAHFNWCLTASEAARKQENVARANQIAGCLSAKKVAADQAKRDACAQYAALAVGQEKENESRQCNFTGGRWSGDFFAHFNWCMGVGPDSTKGESMIRITALMNNCMMRVCTKHDNVSALPPFFSTTVSCRDVPKPAH